MSQQEREIETIKEREIKIKLSDADCERISKLCGEHGISVANLLENFIGDLVGGTYSNGSDERDFARRWFDRCWFGMFPETTLLNFLLNDWRYGADTIFELMEDIEDGKKELEYLEQHPEEAGDGEIDAWRIDIKAWQDDLEEIKAEFLEESPDADWEKELENAKKWLEEKDRFAHG